MALIAAGTGLGQALMVPDGQGYRVVPSEGGHADFAAARRDPDRSLSLPAGPSSATSSWERVLSGPGLASIYRFLQTRAGHAAPDWLRARLQREDAGAVVGEVGLSGRDPVCVEALDLFVSIYGAQAGNLALETLALGGRRRRRRHRAEDPGRSSPTDASRPRSATRGGSTPCSPRYP